MNVLLSKTRKEELQFMSSENLIKTHKIFSSSCSKSVYLVAGWGLWEGGLGGRGYMYYIQLIQYSRNEHSIVNNHTPVKTASVIHQQVMLNTHEQFYYRVIANSHCQKHLVSIILSKNTVRERSWATHLTSLKLQSSLWKAKLKTHQKCHGVRVRECFQNHKVAGSKP